MHTTHTTPYTPHHPHIIHTHTPQHTHTIPYYTTHTTPHHKCTYIPHHTPYTYTSHHITHHTANYTKEGTSQGAVRVCSSHGRQCTTLCCTSSTVNENLCSLRPRYYRTIKLKVSYCGEEIFIFYFLLYSEGNLFSQ